MQWLWVVDGSETRMRRSMTDPGHSNKRFEVFSGGSERSLSNAASRRNQSVSDYQYLEDEQPANSSDKKDNGQSSLLESLDRRRRALGMNRLTALLLCLLFLLGLWEASRAIFPAYRSTPSFFAAPRPFSDQMDALFDPSRSILPASAEPVSADVTAVLLNWKRLPSLKISIEHLCQFAFIKHIVIHNNNPDIKLTSSNFSALQCHPLRLHIHNSPTNQLFLARHSACAAASTPYCLHLDDEYFFASVRSLYSAFKSDPSQLVVAANSEYATLYQYEWRFPNPSIGLDAQFAWLGYGSFVSKRYTQRFLNMTTAVPAMSKNELELADNYFSTFLNKPVTIVESALQAMDNRPVGFSDGASGLERNKLHIDRGLSLLVERLRNQSKKPAAVQAPSYTYQGACASDRCRFISNAQSSLASSDIYPVGNYGPLLPLRRWEERRGYLGTLQSGGRNWTASTDTVALQQWTIKHPASFAVDKDLSTAWMSPFRALYILQPVIELTPVVAIQENDYIGLALLSPFKPSSRPSVRLELVAEHHDLLLPNLVLEVSTDGISWRSALTQSNSFACASTKQSSNIPSPIFPLQRDQQEYGRLYREQSSALSWIERRRLSRCGLGLQTSLPGSSGLGWSYVRLRVNEVKGLQSVGWIVYDVRLVLSPGKISP